ncbi:MAG: hypothetical protein KR126chlam1_00585 [Chlamydiae bacterium]|nr:hypothetical protein [Chlamydiota bacterium]
MVTHEFEIQFIILFNKDNYRFASFFERPTDVLCMPLMVHCQVETCSPPIVILTKF